MQDVIFIGCLSPNARGVLVLHERRLATADRDPFGLGTVDGTPVTLSGASKLNVLTGDDGRQSTNLAEQGSKISLADWSKRVRPPARTKAQTAVLDPLL